MKRLNYLPLLLLMALLFACKKENPVLPQDDANKVGIGSFALLETSRAAVPYYDKSSVTFVDSAGNELTFAITAFDNKSTQGCYWKYNVHETGDTVRYCYETTADNIWLKNESQNLILQVQLEAFPSYADPESGKVADILNVLIRDAAKTNTYHQIFNQTIDHRNYPELDDSNTTYAQITFWSQEFSDVVKTDFTLPPYLLYYNWELGIVAFTDHDGKLWRLKI